MIIGRGEERAHLHGMLDGARAGRGGALLLRGEPGIGKTALLDDLRHGTEGVRVLRARGVESESRLAFLGLSDLLGPVIDRRVELPGPQRTALEAALALGPPGVADRFAAYSAVLGLLTRVAGDGPLLVVVDDIHWVDVPSQEALQFCARRIDDDPVLILAAARETTAEGRVAAEIPEIRIGPLSEADARRLLDASGEGLADAVSRALVDAAEGNPLALQELPRALDAAQRAGRAPLPRDLPVGEALVRAYGRRIEALEPRERRAVLIAAISDDGRWASVVAALEAAGGGSADLSAAEAAGMLVLGPERVRFRHPLLRSVVVRLAAPPDLREAHRLLANALDERAVEQRAWHLADAAVGRDEEAAQALDAAAMSAAGRTGYDAAAGALERAAALGAPEGAGPRSLGAATMAMAAGQLQRSQSLLDDAVLHDGPVRAPAAHLRGIVMLRRGDVDLAAQWLVREGERVADENPTQAAVMIADAVLGTTLGGWCRDALRIAERAYSLALRGGGVPDSVIGYLGGATALRGGARDAWELADRLDEANRAVDPLSVEGQILALSQVWRIWIGDFERESRRLDRIIATARTAGAVGFLAYPLAWACELDFRLGHWGRARARGEEALALLTETGQESLISFAMSGLAMVEAGLGQTESARARAASALEYGRAAKVGSAELYTASVIAFAAMGDGDPDEARRALESVQEDVEAFGIVEPATVLWQPDLIEAYVRLGRLSDARRELAVLAEQAHRTDGAWALAVTGRCRGLIDVDFDRHFGDALRRHEALPMPFERARTELAFGSRLRRAGRRTEARVQLEAALATFDRLGAQPWSRQAREEIAASGGRLRPRTAGRPSDELSPREFQVALAVAGGATNREAAARLFLSEKTIERHLGSVYRKLGLRSRTELARRFAASTAATPDANADD